jgi:hypothetical protein
VGVDQKVERGRVGRIGQGDPTAAQKQGRHAKSLHSFGVSGQGGAC